MMPKRIDRLVNSERQGTRSRVARALLLVGALALLGTACSRVEASTGAQRMYSVSASGFQFHGLRANIKSGLFGVAFSNREPFPITHELVLVSLPAGRSAQDLQAQADARGTDSEDEWLHWGEIGDVATGSTHVGFFQLPPGRYALACWQTGTQGGGTGPPHAALGMVFAFTVTR
jgi:hypothetical protein